ncbi:helix-turn-helix transcriptional regulator [Lacticaseibacillus jixianensis]|uniref:Helix-turn-helix transcriptional regulator n=1 Tax=Lacticaseibacillus jixianensis TaxID=2486012 RepID=A0ABW4BAP0_9LACO|nr:helix-turn-helix transcriptional regulator [Lacticaseibacillus jixianensis]
MSLGQNLADARRHRGLSQEAVAQRLGVSRQTISKWETDETLPDIFQSKKLATLYELSLDKLVSFDADLATIEHAITHTPDSAVAKVDWTAMWAKKYPVLASYQGKVDADRYAAQLRTQLAALRRDYGYSAQDAMLVLKDILSRVWQE